MNTSPSSVPSLRRRLGGGLLGLLLVVPLLTIVDWPALGNLLVEVDLGPLAISFVFYVIAMALMGVRLQVLGEQPPQSFFRYFSISTYHQFFLTLLPSRIGEAALPMLLKRTFARRVEDGIADLVHIRFDDLIWSALFLLVGLVALPEGAPDFWVLIGGGGAALALGVFGRPLIRRSIHMVRRCGPGLRLPGRTGRKVQLLLRRLARAYKALPSDRFVVIFIFGFLILAAGAIRVVYLFQALHLDLSILEAALMLGAANVTGLIPIKGVGGLGPRQYAIALVLVAVGQPVSMAAGAALGLQLSVILFTVALSAGVVFFGKIVSNGNMPTKHIND